MSLKNEDVGYIAALIQLAQNAKTVPGNELTKKLIAEAERYFDEHVKENLITKVNVVPFAKEVVVDGD